MSVDVFFFSGSDLYFYLSRSVKLWVEINLVQICLKMQMKDDEDEPNQKPGLSFLVSELSCKDIKYE